MTAPEQQAREEIDRLLRAAGWHVCDADKANIHAACGVAIREFPLPGHGAEQGSKVEAGYSVQIQERDKKRWGQLDDDFGYDPEQLDRVVVAPDQIRKIIQTYRDKLFTEIYPGREWVPKTLIFAKGEAETGEHPVNFRHAERAGHGWSALGFRAERDARANKHAHADRLDRIAA